MKRSLTLLVLIALASTPLQGGTLNQIESEVHARTGVDLKLLGDDAARTQAASVVDKLLSKPLTVSSAVQIALLSNRNLQATMEEIGIAQADVIEAVTVPNPTVEFDVQFPFTAETMNRYGWLIAQDFVQILMIPLKKRMAQEALEAAQLRVAAQVLDVVADVKKKYFTLQADQQLLGRLRVVQETNATSLDLGQKQFKAGNITELALLQMQASYSEGRLEIAEAESNLEEHREEFNEVLGLWGAQTDWKINGDLPQARSDTFATKHLESLAIAQRLDLRAAHREMTSLATAYKLTKSFRWVPVLDFGFTGERDIDGALNMGPQFRIELPIFNQGQSRVARGEAKLRQAASKFEGLAISIRSETRKFRTKLANLSARAAFYHDEALPTRISILNRSILQYNAMQLGPYELFQAKAAELALERGYINTLRDYWVTRADLERAVGGTLSPRKAEPQDKKVVRTPVMEK